MLIAGKLSQALLRDVLAVGLRRWSAPTASDGPPNRPRLARGRPSAVQAAPAPDSRAGAFAQVSASITLKRSVIFKLMPLLSCQRAPGSNLGIRPTPHCPASWLRDQRQTGAGAQPRKPQSMPSALDPECACVAALFPDELATDAVLDAFEAKLPRVTEADDEQVSAISARVVLALNTPRYSPCAPRAGGRSRGSPEGCSSGCIHPRSAPSEPW
jgi:hypothetical protein